ncbi:hypothetical protein GCM10017771_50140 [Streptomyces capitiformicae]|uniref:Uncharacterized protein n=1 Tax=Streptomyces capitiformicae TaxID=2014920 RepID=A0A919DAU9_9ACTN|nr:hypothetical protein GCM10017771_50140 [Streptomyces capitiformicae]
MTKEAKAKGLGTPESCEVCMAWGLHPNPGGSTILCYVCRAWWYKYPADSCGTYGATVPLRDGVCRACRHQAAFVVGRIKVPSAGHGARLDLTVAAATGHQTFLADLIKWNRRHHLTARTAEMPDSPSETPHRHPLLLKPPESIQLTLFEPVRDFRQLSEPERLEEALLDRIHPRRSRLCGLPRRSGQGRRGGTGAGIAAPSSA